MRMRFGEFLLDDDSFRLTRGGRPVALRRKVFDLLVVLVRERERVVTREELVGRLWSSTTVGAGSLSGLVNELRFALGEGGRGPSSIRTVHARGYQFTAPVVVEPPEQAGAARSVAGGSSVGPIGTGVGLASNGGEANGFASSGDEAVGYAANGLVELGPALAGILRALARADAAAVEAALRSLDPDRARLEPIRAARRVEPGARIGEGRSGSEGL